MIRVEVTGDTALRAGLHRAAAHYGDLSDPTRRAADAVRSTAARIAPKRTGRLARAVTARTAGGAAAISDAIRYARYVEYGTQHMRAQPFMRTALRIAPIVQPYKLHAAQSAHMI